MISPFDSSTDFSHRYYVPNTAMVSLNSDTVQLGSRAPPIPSDEMELFTSESVADEKPALSPCSSPSPPDDDDDDNDIPDAFRLPSLRLDINDLQHEAVPQLLDVAATLPAMVQQVLRLLYKSPTCPTTRSPHVDVITVYARKMSEVPENRAAHSIARIDQDGPSGAAPDPNQPWQSLSTLVQKDIHLSLDYMGRVPRFRRAAEIAGVLCFTYASCLLNDGTDAPFGLRMGIADWVRLRCGLAPPHWSHSLASVWDGGHDSTAFFLNHLERRFGSGTVRRINEKLRIHPYRAETFWIELVGLPVNTLWDDYVSCVNEDGGDLVAFDRKP